MWSVESVRYAARVTVTLRGNDAQTASRLPVALGRTPDEVSQRTAYIAEKLNTSDTFPGSGGLGRGGRGSMSQLSAPHYPPFGVLEMS